MNTTQAYSEAHSANSTRLNYKLGSLLLLVFSTLRFVLVMHANTTGKFTFVFPIFLLMWILPFVFLDKKGRRQIGIRRPERASQLFISFASGALLCVIVYFTGLFLFGHTTSNWFVYMARPFEAQVAAVGVNPTYKLILFLVSAIIAMTFSPIGEELLYRGMVHESFTPKFGSRKASYIDSAAFAGVHLAHFGVVYISGSWTVLWVPAVLWFFFMFLASQLFYFCRVRSGSILGAIVSHAGFNLAMMYFTFYELL